MMQTSLMFVDLKPLGVTPNSQKLAIKIPEGSDNMGVNGDSGFTDMINALMAITPEQLQNCFGQMEWVKVQGESSGFAPLLDLSKAQTAGTEMAQMVFGELAQNNSQQSKPLGLKFVDIGRLEDGSVGFIKKNTGQFSPKDPYPPPLALSKGTITQPGMEPTVEEMSQTVEVSTIAQVAKTTVDSDPQGGAGDTPGHIKSIQNKLEGVHQPSGQTQIQPGRAPIQPTHMAPQTNDEAAATAIINEDEPAGKDASASNSVKASSAQSVSNPKDRNTSPIVPEEMLNKSTKPNAPGVERVVVNQNNDKVKLSPDQATDQQFGDGNDPGEKYFLKQASGERQPSDGMRQHFSASQVDVSSEASIDETDPLTSARQDNKALFQQVVSRLKGAHVQSVEHASSQHEPAPQTSDIQSNVIRQIVQRMSLHHQGSQSTMTLKLKPEFLGNVHMQISTDNHQVVVRMATESAAVKEMVEQGLQYLKTEMHHHGLEIDKFEVFVANDNEESHPGQDWAGFRQALKQRQQNAMKKVLNESNDEHNEISDQKVGDRHVTDNTGEIDYFA
jgi:flagellar hook-length control protein FliK